MKWEDLTTFDRALVSLRAYPHNSSMLPKAYYEHMLGALQKAQPHRFAITDNAAKRIGAALAVYPELVAKNSDFAIPPFKTMWVEFATPAMFEHNRLSPGAVGPDADKRVGYLFEGNVVTVYAEGDELKPHPTVFAYQLHAPLDRHGQSLLAGAMGTSRLGLDPFFWGHTLYEHLTPGYRRALRAKHGMTIHRSLRGWAREHPDAASRILTGSYYGSAGEIRNILAILLMLNQPSHVVFSSGVARQRGLVRGKPMPYFGHSVVDINLDAPARKLLARHRLHGTHASPRWHEVRGHFCHNRAARKAGCEHVWQEVAPRKWECACGGKRWWREVPEGRGTAAVGFVRQQRRIRTGEDHVA